MHKRQGKCVQLHHCYNLLNPLSADSSLCCILLFPCCCSPSPDPCHILCRDLEPYHSLCLCHVTFYNPCLCYILYRNHHHNDLCIDPVHHVHTDQYHETCAYLCLDLCCNWSYHNHYLDFLLILCYAPFPCNNLCHDQMDLVQPCALNLDFSAGPLLYQTDHP